TLDRRPLEPGGAIGPGAPWTDGARYRARDLLGLRRSHRAGSHDLLERAHGSLRKAALRPGHAGDCASGCRCEPRPDGRGRWRLGCGGSPGGRCRPVEPCLDRGRSIARVPGGQDAPRACGTRILSEASMARTPFICGNWKLHKTISEAVNLATEL